jgi:hypothetical protein
MSFLLKFEEDVIGYEGKIEDGSHETILNLEKQIEELKDHELDLIIEEEAPMQILNLKLQEQHQNFLEGLLSEDDDYVDWIRCAIVEENAWMLQKLGKNIEPNVHLYPVQVSNDLIEEGNRWTQIKNKIGLNEPLNEEHQK